MYDPNFSPTTPPVLRLLGGLQPHIQMIFDARVHGIGDGQRRLRDPAAATLTRYRHNRYLRAVREALQQVAADGGTSAPLAVSLGVASVCDATEV